MSTINESYLVGLIGDGITASLTPYLHEAEAAAQGLHYLYRPIDLSMIGRPGADVGQLLAAGRDLGFNAFNITYPCKQTVLAYLEQVSDQAQALQAVNTVLIKDGLFVGHNTDQTGFSSALATGLPGVRKERVFQCGTGGAGSAVAFALLESGVQHLTLFDIDGERAAERATTLRAYFPGADVTVASDAELDAEIAHADGVVNCTPIGMHHHPGTPLDLSLLTSRHWVVEVIYLPIETPLVRHARSLGCRVLDGGVMAVKQAADAFRLVTGLEADRERMRTHFLELLAARQG